MAHYNRAGMLHLIIKELTEILHVHLAFSGVNNGRKRIEHNVFTADILNRSDNVRQFADTRRLNYNSVGRKLRKHFFKRLAEVADKTAANTA